MAVGVVSKNPQVGQATVKKLESTSGGKTQLMCMVKVYA